MVVTDQESKLTLKYTCTNNKITKMLPFLKHFGRIHPNTLCCIR